MYETFDHTADLGLRVTAASAAELFVEAARGLVSVLIENPEEIRPTEERTLTLPGEAIDYLLFDWLSELLYLFERSRFVAGVFQVQLGESGLQAILRGETIDPTRHRLSHEVKAITYHDLIVQESESGWEAEMIVDI